MIFYLKKAAFLCIVKSASQIHLTCLGIYEQTTMSGQEIKKNKKGKIHVK